MKGAVDWPLFDFIDPTFPMPGYGRRTRKTAYRGRRTRRGGYTARRTAAMPAKYRKALSTIVDKRIHRNIETKYAAQDQRPTTIPAVIGDIQALNLMRVIPPIALGVNSNARVGRKIAPRWLEIKGWVQHDMAAVEADYDRVCVRLAVVTPKQYPLHPDAVQQISSAPGVNWTNQLMDYGNVVSEFNGTLSALQAPFNKGVVRVHGQRYLTLTRPRFYDAALVGSDSFRYSGNSVRFFKMRIRCPKNLIYRSITGNDLYPMNFDPTFVCGYTLLNGATPGSPGPTAPKQVTVSYTARFRYEDA